jgi:hypothetical protein
MHQRRQIERARTGPSTGTPSGLCPRVASDGRKRTRHTASQPAATPSDTILRCRSWPPPKPVSAPWPFTPSSRYFMPRTDKGTVSQPPHSLDRAICPISLNSKALVASRSSCSSCMVAFIILSENESILSPCTILYVPSEHTTGKE